MRLMMKIDPYTMGSGQFPSPVQEPAPDLDIDTGLMYCDQSETLLSDLLRMFAERTPGILDNFRSAVAEGHFDEARRNVHSIKGIALTVGAKRLYELSSRYEHALKMQDFREVPRMSRALDQAWTDLTGRINSYLSQVRRPPAASPLP